MDGFGSFWLVLSVVVGGFGWFHILVTTTGKYSFKMDGPMSQTFGRHSSTEFSVQRVSGLHSLVHG